MNCLYLTGVSYSYTDICYIRHEMSVLNWLSCHYWYLLYRTWIVCTKQVLVILVVISVISDMRCLFWTDYHVITDICYIRHEMSVLNWLSCHYWYLLYKTWIVCTKQVWVILILISVISDMRCLFWIDYHVITDICYIRHELSELNKAFLFILGKILTEEGIQITEYIMTEPVVKKV